MTEVLTRVPVRFGDREAVIVVARGGGLTGLGEAPLLAGRSPETALRAAEECARQDLEARRRGVRLAELLGAVRRDAVECSALVVDARATDVAQRVAGLAAAGYRCFKLKAANGGGVVDEERVGAARWAAGRGARIRIDFNGGLTAAEALRRLPSLLRFGVELFEQPLAPEAPLGDWLRLRDAGLPVAADESLGDPELAGRLAAEGIALAAKVATVGGVGETLALLNSARGPVTLGSSMETSIGIAGALHVACALEAEPLPCGLATRGRAAGDVARGLGDDGPRLALPAGPGLGVEIDEAALARYRVER